MKTTTYFGAVMLAFTLGTAVSTGCSIADPADETALEELAAATEAATPGTLRRAAMLRAARLWLDPKNKFKFDRLFDLECRRVGLDGGTSPWTKGWGVDRVVLDALSCVVLDGKLYTECLSELIANQTGEVQVNWIKTSAAQSGVKLDCRPSFRDDFAPSQAPKKVVDPKAITTDDLAKEWLDRPLPILVPGLPIGVPVPGPLCPLDDWGCPSDPDDPIPSGPKGDG